MKTKTKKKRDAADAGRTARDRAAAEPVRPAATDMEPASRQVEAPVVALPAHCGVKDAAALKQMLCKVAHESATVSVDVAALERIDTAAMQLLCAFVRDRAARNQNVAWTGTSQAFEEAARVLGAGSLLAHANVPHSVEAVA